jgi:hypothetical protein
MSNIKGYMGARQYWAEIPSLSRKYTTRLIRAIKNLHRTSRPLEARTATIDPTNWVFI